MAAQAPPSFSICDMGSERVLRRSSVILPPFELTDASVGMDVRNYYVMHTGMVKVNVTSLHTFEYIRDIKKENVKDIVQNIMV